jgi:glycosyltransferase involved in cell wall biosynthesis
MPFVSIIVPCYNEQATIRLLLDAIYQQSFPIHDLEIVIADGMSEDLTREEVGSFQKEHPDLQIRLVDNQKRNIPAGLNCALRAAQGQYIIRLDAHSAPGTDYVKHCVEDLESGCGENVGGVWEIRPRGNTLMQRAIAVAAAHPFGVGDARYRYTNQASFVDTVPFGAFHREVFDKFGLFDENLLTNEDYEFNARLRQGGGRIWLDPRIRSTYFARPNLESLSLQYWRYGYWKWRMLQRYPKTLRWRQALPPVFVLSLVVLLLLSMFWAAARIMLVSEILLYLLVLIAGTLPVVSRRRDPGLILTVPLAILVMHLSWGTGFLWSMVSSSMKRMV